MRFFTVGTGIDISVEIGIHVYEKLIHKDTILSVFPSDESIRCFVEQNSALEHAENFLSEKIKFPVFEIEISNSANPVFISQNQYWAKREDVIAILSAHLVKEPSRGISYFFTSFHKKLLSCESKLNASQDREQCLRELYSNFSSKTLFSQSSFFAKLCCCIKQPQLNSDATTFDFYQKIREEKRKNLTQQNDYAAFLVVAFICLSNTVYQTQLQKHIPIPSLCLMICAYLTPPESTVNDLQRSLTLG